MITVQTRIAPRLARAHPRAPHIVLGGVAVLAALGAVAPAHAQRVVPVHQEPRHRLIHESETLRVLDVQILPGDTTLYHTHDAPITYVTISTSTTDSRTVDREWSGAVERNPPPGRIGAVRAVLGYAERPLTHRVTNVGSTMFRLIAIPSRGSGTDAPGGAALPGAPEGESRWFRHSTVELGPGETTDAAMAVASIAVVLVEAGRVTVDRTDGWAPSLEAAGAVSVVERGTGYHLTNRGSSVARLVLVEVR